MNPIGVNAASTTSTRRQPRQHTHHGPAHHTERGRSHIRIVAKPNDAIIVIENDAQHSGRYTPRPTGCKPVTAMLVSPVPLIDAPCGLVAAHCQASEGVQLTSRVGESALPITAVEIASCIS